MALTIIQNAATSSLAQSPIAFSVSSSINVTQSGFQYAADLYFWDGGLADSGSARYTLVKFPNFSGTGIFDFSKIINSDFSDLAINSYLPARYYKAEFYTQWISGSGYVTGSEKVFTAVRNALNGYQIFQETIGAQLATATPFFPIMTDGPVTQSILSSSFNYPSVYNIGDNNQAGADKMCYTGSNGQTAEYALTAYVDSYTLGDVFPAFPTAFDFPLSSSVDWFTVQAASATTKLGRAIYYDVVCNQKYPNVQIIWKNRFGGFDAYPFNLVSQQSFNVDRKTYQPQIGTWNLPTLSYNVTDSQNIPYIVNASQGINVNSNWLTQDWNDVLKQLLSSEEIYWITETSSIPLIIETSNIVFKTGVVDKLIQYQFSFRRGQNYKLII
jgi:hypothetical protein